MCAIMLTESRTFLFHFENATHLTHRHFATVIKLATDGCGAVCGFRTGIFVHMMKWHPNVNSGASASDTDEGKDEDVAQNAKRRRFQRLISQSSPVRRCLFFFLPSHFTHSPDKPPPSRKTHMPCRLPNRPRGMTGCHSHTWSPSKS